MTSSVQNRWAFLVGVNQYEEPSAGALSYCAKDVAALAELLDQADYQVVCLHDEVTDKALDKAPDKALLPTHTRIKGRLSGLKGQFGLDDLLLVYFACHGTRQGDGLPRLMVADTWRSQLAESAIAVSDIERWMQASGAGQQVLMLDACHMGQGKAEREMAWADEFERAVQALPPQGVAVLTSSTAQQTAREVDALQHGLFSHHVLLGLSGAARGPNGVSITVASLRQYLHRALAAEAFMSGIPQKPQGRLEGDLDLAQMVLVNDCEKIKLDALGELASFGKVAGERGFTPAGTQEQASQRQASQRQADQKPSSRVKQLRIEGLKKRLLAREEERNIIEDELSWQGGVAAERLRRQLAATDRDMERLEKELNDLET